jgi:hypothetical protein
MIMDGECYPLECVSLGDNAVSGHKTCQMAVVHGFGIEGKPETYITTVAVTHLAP